MITLASQETCSGCSACYAACPRRAISMVPDDEGFLFPRIDSSRCVECHLCEKSCPVLTLSRLQKPTGSDFFAARAKDMTVRMASSSGGLFTEIARTVLAQQGILFGCGWEPDTLTAIHMSVETEEGLAKLRGSKYVQSDLRDTFREVKAALLKGRQVLFSGTPCQIAGLHTFLGKPYANLLTVEIVCHGVPSPLVWERYTQKWLPPPKDVSFREKGHGGTWRFGNLTQWFKDGSVKRFPFFRTYYGQGFYSSLFFRRSCATCPFKEGISGADLTIADLWGAETILPEWDNPSGVSLLIIHSEKGRAAIGDAIERRPIDAQAAVTGNARYASSLPAHPNRDWFFVHFKTESFAHTVAYALRGPWYRRTIIFTCRATAKVFRTLKRFIKHR